VITSEVVLLYMLKFVVWSFDIEGLLFLICVKNKHKFYFLES